ncbi:MAG: UDP-N-acetylmuramoyl-L-alanyl-D-glutamate--2,6-diaminopimelate ligase [Alphaproteobacteria bacterium]|nr:UDP-N-acetylmuramoyl-L-alanyl-D-glutamate--2,6-diaminopimelate ligase [Alphaproteobacteria bacterium]
MRLSNLIAPDSGITVTGEDCLISGITPDSRHVKAGCLYVAIPGTKLDGNTFISEALCRGAAAIVVEGGTDISSLPQGIPTVIVPDARQALSLIASRYYPRQPQIIAAVTGTSGKTSTVQFTRKLWAQGGHQAASLGTLGLISPQTTQYGTLTTPDPVTLHQLIDQLAGEGVTHLAMEASSHGIHLHRLDHVRVNVAAFTNLSRDHLDYHETMEAYFSAKLRLFSTLLRPDGAAVLNADIDEFEDLKGICEARNLRVLSFGRQSRDIKLIDSSPQSSGQLLQLELFGKPYDIHLPIIGTFQIWNSLCALAIAVGSGENPEKMVAALEKLSCVPGRLELIGTTASGGTVFVDYAHKPAALENMLETLRPHVSAHPGAKLHVVFGCGGNRDKGKRPLMGSIGQRLADYVIITDDNPRDENPAQIRQEILSGCQQSETLREIGNRKQAIIEGISALGAGDVLVIAGKGHEEGQIIGDTVLPFCDALEARKVLGLA